MINQDNNGQLPHEISWEVACAARELRLNKKATLRCLESEKPTLIQQLNSFSNSKPIMMNTFNKPNSQEVFIEIFNT